MSRPSLAQLSELGGPSGNTTRPRACPSTVERCHRCWVEYQYFKDGPFIQHHCEGFLSSREQRAKLAWGMANPPWVDDSEDEGSSQESDELGAVDVLRATWLSDKIATGAGDERAERIYAVVEDFENFNEWLALSKLFLVGWWAMPQLFANFLSRTKKQEKTKEMACRLPTAPARPETNKSVEARRRAAEKRAKDMEAYERRQAASLQALHKRIVAGNKRMALAANASAAACEWCRGRQPAGVAIHGSWCRWVTRRAVTP